MLLLPYSRSDVTCMAVQARLALAHQDRLLQEQERLLDDARRKEGEREAERIRREECERLRIEEQERRRQEQEAQGQEREAQRQAEVMKRIIRRMRMQGVLAAFETWSGNVEEVVYARRLLKRVAYRWILRGHATSSFLSLSCAAMG